MSEAVLTGAIMSVFGMTEKLPGYCPERRVCGEDLADILIMELFMMKKTEK